MGQTMQVLQAAPVPEVRTETVDCPELGGAVVCRGLLASQAFAVSGLRSQALRRVREARADQARRAAADGPAPEGQPADREPFEAPDLDFDELLAYGRYIAHLLACGVTTANGMALYTAEQWEVMGQHHPALLERLQPVVERLSGMGSQEDVRKNSPPTPS